MTPAARDCFRTYSTSPDRRPGLTVTRMTPAMAAPNSTMIHSGMLWAQIATRSPGSKRARSARAVRKACAYNSAYVHCRRLSRSGTPAISAIRSGVVSAAHCSSSPSVMSRTVGSFAPAAWEMVSMIVSSIEWARFDSVANFNETRVPNVTEYGSRALQRGENPRPAECADENKGRPIGTAGIAICECGQTPAASSRDDDARFMNFEWRTGTGGAGTRSSRLATMSVIGLCLLYPGGIEAGKVAIGFGIFRAAHSLTIFNDGRTAARLPGGLCFRVGLLFLRRSRPPCLPPRWQPPSPLAPRQRRAHDPSKMIGRTPSRWWRR